MDNFPPDGGQSGPPDQARRPRPTNENPNFVQEYFANSRLHFIGSFRARFETMMGEVARRLNVHPSVLLAAPTRPARMGKDRIIVHIDMDCFFASVAVAAKPDLAGRPIAVCHARVSSDGTRTAGSGEISSCSYEARAHGVRAGMFFAEGLKLCPGLIGVPYDFEAYERVSIAIYARFFSISGAVVEACSVDEAYLDVTDVPNVDPEQLVAELREHIFLDNKCRASAGIGPSRLLARLATKRAKPNGQVRIRAEQAPEFVAALSLDDLPGVGWRTGRRLAEKGINSCAALLATPLVRLQAEFGDRQGRAFYDAVRGVDERPVQPMKPRKSIGAEASWGVRFDSSTADHAKCVKFIDDMAKEVASRVVAAGALGTKVLYKAYRMKENAGRAHKYYGHGPCDIFTRSAKLVGKVNTDNMAKLLAQQCQRIHAELKIPNNEFRGVGIQVTDLSFESFSLGGKHSVGGSAGRIDLFLKQKGDQNAFSQTLLKGKILESDHPMAESLMKKGNCDENSRGRIDSFFKRLSHPNAPPPISLKRKLMEYDAAQAKRRRASQIPPHVVQKMAKGNSSADEIVPVKNNTAEEPALSLDGSNEEITKVVRENIVSTGDASPVTKDGLPIPGDWDPAVFSALPAEIRDELLASHLQTLNPHNSVLEQKSSTTVAQPGVGQLETLVTTHRRLSKEKSVVPPGRGRGNRGRKPRKRESVQVTMTQFAQVAKLKSHGHAILNASQLEEKKLSECIEIAADLEDAESRKRNGLPATASANQASRVNTESNAEPVQASSSSDSENDVDLSKDVSTLIAEAGASKKRVFAEESVAAIAGDLQSWMVHVGSNIRSAHIELLRSRLFELLRLHKLTRVCSEVRMMSVFANDLKETQWISVLSKLVADTQNECRRVHGFTLQLGGI